MLQYLSILLCIGREHDYNNRLYGNCVNIQQIIYRLCTIHLGGFQFGVIMNTAVISSLVHTFGCTYVHIAIGHVLGMELLGPRAYRCSA